MSNKCPLHSRRIRPTQVEEFTIGAQNCFRSSFRGTNPEKNTRENSDLENKRMKRYRRIELPTNYQNISEQNYSFYVSQFGSAGKKNELRGQRHENYCPLHQKPKKNNDDSNYNYYESKNILRNRREQYPQIVVHKRRDHRSAEREPCPYHGH